MAGAKGTIRIYFEALVVTLLVASFVRVFLVQGVRISSGSMEPTLLVGDHLLVNRVVPARATGPLGRLLPTREIRRGDLLLHRYPGRPATLLVKRCIGLPGERVELREGRVLVDGEALDRWGGGPTSASGGPISTVVPAGHFFVLGDRREQSIDSRDWGLVPESHVLGRPFFSYWSWRAATDRNASTLSRTLDLVTHFVPGTRWNRTGRRVR